MSPRLQAVLCIVARHEAAGVPALLCLGAQSAPPCRWQDCDGPSLCLSLDNMAKLADLRLAGAWLRCAKRIVQGYSGSGACSRCP